MIIYVHIFIYDIRMWLIAWAQTFPSWLMTPNDDKPGKNWLPVYRAEQMHHAQSSTVREMERLWHVHGSIWFLSDNYGKFAVRIFRTQMAILGLLGDIRWYYIIYIYISMYRLTIRVYIYIHPIFRHSEIRLWLDIWQSPFRRRTHAFYVCGHLEPKWHVIIFDS